MNNNKEEVFIDYCAEVVLKQFEKKCENLNQKYNCNIDPNYYISQFNLYHSSIKYFSQLQEDLYVKLKEKFPNVDFGIRGRTKTALSYFDKVLKKLEKNPFEIAEVLDQFANKIFIRSIDFPIDKIINYYDGSFGIFSGISDLTFMKNDAFSFNINPKYPQQQNTIVLKNPSEQIIKKGDQVFVKDLDNGIMRNMADATLKRSNKDSLIPYLYEMRNFSSEFYSSLGFKRCKIKDYISTPKESGYSALQDSFYSPKLNLSIETQYKTQDMETASKKDPKQARNTYKKGSREINENTLYQVPHYALTTSIYDKTKNEVVPITYNPSDDKCLEYTFHITKEDYLKEMALQSRIKILQQKLENANSEAEVSKLQAEIRHLESQSINHKSPKTPSRS